MVNWVKRYDWKNRQSIQRPSVGKRGDKTGQQVWLWREEKINSRQRPEKMQEQSAQGTNEDLECRNAWRKTKRRALMEDSLKRGLGLSGCTQCQREAVTAAGEWLCSQRQPHMCTWAYADTHTLTPPHTQTPGSLPNNLPPLLLPEGRLLMPLILKSDSSVWHESDVEGQSLIWFIYLFVILQPR